MTDAAATPAGATNLPMFYKNPMPLEPVRHAAAGIKQPIHFRFAAGTNAIPVTASEMAHAARTYPIVFSANAPTVPFVVVGLRDNENLFGRARRVAR